MKAKEIKSIKGAERYVESCINDFESGISTKEETMKFLFDYTVQIIEMTKRSQQPKELNETEFNKRRLDNKLKFKDKSLIDSFCKNCGIDVQDFIAPNDVWDKIKVHIPKGNTLCYNCFCELCIKCGINYGGVWNLVNTNDLIEMHAEKAYPEIKKRINDTILQTRDEKDCIKCKNNDIQLVNNTTYECLDCGEEWAKNQSSPNNKVDALIEKYEKKDVEMGIIHEFIQDLKQIKL